jgi:WD40 repeat protein
MELGPFQDEARAVSFSPKEPLLTVGIRDASVRTWDTTTFTERERIRGYGAIYALTFLPDGRLAFHNTRREIALCNLQNWGTERVNVSHGVHVNSVRLVRHDTDLFLGAMSNDERSVVHLWRINKEGLAQRLSIKPGVSIGCFAVSCHGTWVFGDFESDAVVLLDNPLQTESRTTLQSPAKGAVSTAFSKDGCRLAVGYKDGHVVIWQRRLEKPHWTVLKQWRAHMGRVNSLAFHSKDVAILATGSWDGTARVWNVDEGPALNIGWPVDTCFDVAFSPSGDLVAASGYSRGILLWNWPSKLGRTPLVGHSLPADAVQFLPNEKTLVSAGTDRLIKLWDLMSGQERCSLDGETSIFTSLSISPDGIVIAAGARDGTVRLYRRATEKEVAAAGW